MRILTAYILLLQVLAMSLNSPEFGVTDRVHIQSPRDQQICAVGFLDDLGLEMRTSDDSDEQHEETETLTSSVALFYPCGSFILPHPDWKYDTPISLIHNLFAEHVSSVVCPPPRCRFSTISLFSHLEDECHSVLIASSSAHA